MAFNDELDILLKDLADEAKNFKNAESREEETEALKDMLDVFMRGTQSVRERIDQYNERRWNRWVFVLAIKVFKISSLDKSEGSPY